MKLMVKLCRGYEIPCKWVMDVLALNPLVYIPKEIILENLRQRFGLLSPGVELWWPGRQDWEEFGDDVHSGRVTPPGAGWGVKGWSCIVMADAMRFDLPRAGVIVKGIVQADPIDPVSVSQLDGALVGELARWGITVEPRSADWCQVYEGKADEVERANRAIGR